MSAVSEPLVLPARRQGRTRITLVRPLGLALVGFGGFVGLWALVGAFAPDLPTPVEGFSTLGTLLAHPFADHGGSDKGVGLQVAASLQRVFVGFLLASIVAVPLGCAMGASRSVWSALNPLVQLLRPVSPLAWFPIGLVVAKNSPEAATFVIFVTALWPTVLNTAMGVASVPEDHKNVARVFRFGRVKYVRHVLLPHSLPSILTGMRISMGIAWMVIVAVEMMSASTGIGAYVWNAYNGGDLSEVIAAIFVIGGVGLLLDLGFSTLQRRLAYEAAS